MTMPDLDLDYGIPVEAVLLIAEREGCKLEAYKCPAGIWTCGWGNTGLDVDEDTVYTQAEADEKLAERLREFSAQVAAECTREPTPNQLGAMTSLAYNIGINAFAKSSVLQKHDEACGKCIPGAFALWNKATVNKQLVVLPGLVKRRAAEAELYFKP